MTDSKFAYDLEERTFLFSKQAIIFCKSISQTTVSRPIINQLVKSATSIGANYIEANGASSKKDFRNKIFIAKKEAKETSYWLRLAVEISHSHSEIAVLQQECHELILIFQKITSSLKDV